VFGEPGQFFELVEELSTKVTRAVNVELEDTETGKKAETRSLDARIAYSDGLVALDNGNYQAAYDYFQEALEHDPDYELAQTKANSIQPMIAAEEASGETSGSGR